MGFPRKISELPLRTVLKNTDLFVSVDVDTDITNKVTLESLATFIGGENQYVTGGTYNELTETIDFVGNEGFPPFSIDVSKLAEDTYVTGGSLNGAILEIDRNNGEPTISIDLSPLSGDTNTFVTGTSLNNTIYTINQNDGSSFSTDFEPLISGFTSGNTLQEVLDNGSTASILTDFETIVNNGVDGEGNLTVGSGYVGFSATDGTSSSQSVLGSNQFEITATDSNKGVVLDATLDWIDLKIEENPSKNLGVFIGNDTNTIGIKLTDTFNNRGAFYQDDYSTNGISEFGDRWIPDKGWVDNRISGFTTGNTLQEVIENGSVYSGTDIIQINSSNGIILSSNITSTVSAFGLNSSGTKIKYEDLSGNKREVSIFETEFKITDEITSKGLEYASDYSSNFTNESLVTKRYVDNSISGITIEDNFVTGATLNGNILEIERNNGLSAVTVDLSSLSASTPTIDEVIATGNQLTSTNNRLLFPNTGFIDWTYSSPNQLFYVTGDGGQIEIKLISQAGQLVLDSSKVSLFSNTNKDLELKVGSNSDEFRIYLGTTGPSIGDVLEVKSLDGNTGIMGWATPTVSDNVFVLSGDANAATQQLTFTNTTGGTFNVTNAAALFSDNDINVTGGTYNPTTGCITFSTNSGSTFDVCGFVTGLTDTYTSSGTYDNNTAEITFTRTDASTYTVDLSTLDLNDTYVTGGTVSLPATDDSNSGNIGLFYKNSDGTPRVLPFEDTFTTGSTFDSGTNILTFGKNDGSSYNVDLSTLNVNDTFSTGGTVTQSPSSGSSEVTVQIVGNEGFIPYNITGLTDTFVNDFSFSSNTFTISQNDGSSFDANLDTIDLSNILSGVSFDIATSGSISATTFNGGTFVGDGSGLSGITQTLQEVLDNGSTATISASTFSVLSENGVASIKTNDGTVNVESGLILQPIRTKIYIYNNGGDEKVIDMVTTPQSGIQVKDDIDFIGMYYGSSNYETNAIPQYGDSWIPHVGYVKTLISGSTSGLTQNLQNVLTVGNETSGNDIIMTEGDDVVFKYAGWNNRINTNPLTTHRNILFPDKSGTVALLSDTTGHTENFYVTGFDYNDANTFTLTRNGGLSALTTTINTMTGLTVNGTLVVDTISATTINGSVSGLTLNDLDDVTINIPTTPDNTYQGELIYFDVTTNQWVSGSEYGNLGEVTIWGKKGSAGTIDKGLPVYITGFDDDIHEVELANATTATTMPVIGFTAEDFDNAGVYPIVTFGKITGLDTTSTVSTLNPNGETWVVNDVLYMDKTDGGLTKNRPSGTNTEIQRVAKVLRVSSNSGQLFIFNTARTAGLPNLTSDYLWIGNGLDRPLEIVRTDVGITTTGFTYNDNNTFTITDDNGGSLSTTINQMSGLTINGDLTVTGNTQLDSNLIVEGQTTLRGQTTIGNSFGDSLDIVSRLTSSIVPNSDNTVDLGDGTRRWRNIYGHNITGDTLTLLNTPTLNNSGIEVLVRNSSTGEVEYRNVSTIGEWTSGSTGSFSIKADNDSGLDATGNYSVASGFNTLSSGSVSFVHSSNSTATSDRSVIIGGRDNNIITSSSESSIIGGVNNSVAASINGHILGGDTNSVEKNSDLSVIIAGSGNTIGNGATYSTILNGYNNEIGVSSHIYSTIIGGINNRIGSGASTGSGIFGGDTNVLTNTLSSAIIGGTGNTLSNTSNSVIVGGNGINATDDNTVYVPKLNISTVGGTTPVTNLGIDTNGNVVSGTTGGGGTGVNDANKIFSWFMNVT